MEITNDKEELGETSPIRSKDVMQINFSTYNTPKFSEQPGKDWINYGSDNLYCNYLIDVLNKSATHNAIIESKIKQIIGDGIVLEDSEDKDQMAAIMKLIKKTNRYESFNDIIRKIAFDLEVFGGFALNLIWSRDRSCISEIHHVDFTTLRVAKPDEKTGEVKGYYFSENWKKANTAKHKPVFMDRFDTGNRINASQILYVKPYRANTLFYPLPSYIGALNYIELDYEVSNYQLNSVKNGLSPSLMINFNNGQPTIQERTEIFNTINNTFRGSDAAGKFMLFFNKSVDTAATVTPILNNELDKIYTVLNESITQNICTGHRVTSTGLMGISTPGSLGSSQELMLASELFFSEVIGPEQALIEEVINKILGINGFTLKVTIKDIQPVSFQLAETTMLQVLTLDEIRAKIGLCKLNDEQRNEIYNRNGITATDVPAPPAPASATPSAETQAAEPVSTNDNIKNLNAKQHMQLMRIIRQVSKGQLTREAGSVLLKTGLGLIDSDIDAILPISEEDMDIQTPGVLPYTKEIDKNKNK